MHIAYCIYFTRFYFKLIGPETSESSFKETRCSGSVKNLRDCTEIKGVHVFYSL